MTEIKLEQDSEGKEQLNIYEGDQKVGEMSIKIQPDRLTVYHTLVDPEQQGKGYAGMLFSFLVDYARKHHLEILPLCAYVRSRFEREPALYKDVWSGGDEGTDTSIF